MADNHSPPPPSHPHPTSLMVNYVDFQMVFDNIHREGLRNTVAEYGISSKLINIMKDIYKDSECSISVNDGSSERFAINTGIKQGCIFCPFSVCPDHRLGNEEIHTWTEASSGQLSYLAGKVSAGGNIIRKVRTRIAKFAEAFNSLNNIKKNQNSNRTVKLNLFTSNVLAVQMPRSERWCCPKNR